MATTSNFSLGDGLPGIMPRQTVNTWRDGDAPRIRSILRRAWNTEYATGSVQGHQRAIGPFKAVSNIGDFLSRPNYVCGYIPNGTQPDKLAWRTRTGRLPHHNCDDTGVPVSNCNTKFVPDSSDYITYKKQRAMNVLYNDSSTGGNKHNAQYVDMMARRRFF